VSEELRLSILSPERRLVESLSVDEVTLTGSEGQIQVLPGHASMIATLTTGLFRYRVKSGGTVVGVISSGFCRVSNSEVQILAETVELKSEIDIDRAKRAQRLAEETLQAANLDVHQFKKYQLKLQRSLIRQQIAGHES